MFNTSQVTRVLYNASHPATMSVGRHVVRMVCLTAKPLQRLPVEFDAQAGLVRDEQVALRVHLERLGDDLLDVGRGGQVLDVGSDRHGGGKLEVSSEADSCVPAVRNP